MEIKDIFKLVDAGFTKEDIMKLAGAEKKAPEKNEQPEVKEEKKDPEPEVEKEEPKNPKIDDVISKLDTLTKAVQSNNIQQSRQPEPDQLDDILATIIDPTYKKEKQ